MSLASLITQFSQRDEFPVGVDEVCSWIIKKGIQDEIDFYPVEMEPSILKGMFNQFTYHKRVYGDPVFVTQIIYCNKLNFCWERIVTCKELMHVFDRPEERTFTREGVSSLTYSLATGARDSNPDYIADRIAVFKALALLAPLPAVDQMRNGYSSRAITDLDIALYFRIPANYVSLLFTEEYKSLYSALSS